MIVVEPFMLDGREWYAATVNSDDSGAFAECPLIAIYYAIRWFRMGL